MHTQPHEKKDAQIPNSASEAKLLLQVGWWVAEDVACDAASPGVRLAVVQGLTGLVDNPLAQPLLKMVLPKLGPLLHDKALKVRTAVADLLLAVM